MSLGGIDGVPPSVLPLQGRCISGRRRLYLILASVAVLSGTFAEVSFADDREVELYRNYTPRQIANLDEKTRSSQVPMMYIFAAQRGLAIDSEILFGMQLNALMYSGLHDYDSAVKNFQRDLGDQPTGVLTVWQIHQLEQRFEMQKLSRVAFPEGLTSWKDDDNALIKGTMILIDEKIAWPINHVKVTCDRKEGYCELDEIDLSVPDAKSWIQQYQVLRPSPEYYIISRWNEDSIDGYLQRKGACRTTSLNLNFKTKEFYYITRNAGGKCEILGTTLDTLPKPRIAQIVDGTETINREFSKIQKAAYDVLSNDFRSRVEKLDTETKPRTN
jgi:hypothetical protein